MKTKLLVALAVSTFAVGAQAASCGSEWNWNNACSDANKEKVRIAEEKARIETAHIAKEKELAKIAEEKARIEVARIAKEKVRIAANKPVGIVDGVMEVAGISRNQDSAATIDPAFAKTSRPCPPFCIQPTHPFAPAAVDTVSELDIIHAVRDLVEWEDDSILVVDARTPAWVKKGTIPHSVNVPFTKLNSKALAKDPMAVVDVLTGNFGVKDMDGVLNFDNAKTLYLFCNGSWCGQSPAAIKALLTMGYPQSKIKYYRGGMNDWKLLGLTVK